MAGARESITWPRAVLWSVGTGLVVAGMFGAVLGGWQLLHPADPFLASLSLGEVLGLLAAIFAATFGTCFYWFTFMLADRRASRSAERDQGVRKPPV